ncbi:MAG: Hsp33 family molecular chaperone HslO [Clostridia bacterium]|nr:Hsp33 family molecular chaperone HslO [Clostridia bacterium]
METTEKKDTMLGGLLLGKTVNMIAISGRDLVEEARRLHSLSRVCTAALGRLLLAVSMMSARLKAETDSITVTFAGGGPAGNLTAVGHTGGIVKGCITNPEIELPPNALGKLDVAGAVGTAGEMRVIRDLSMKEPYVGRCSLVSGEIANDFANYFLVSEQQPSLVYLGVRVEPESGEVRSAAGLMLTPLPNCPDEDIEKLEALAGEISQLSLHLDEGSGLRAALEKLFCGLDLEITDELSPAYRCDCSRERLESVIISLGETELTDIIENDGCAELVCSFCGKHYNFDKSELTALLEEAKARAAEPEQEENE